MSLYQFSFPKDLHPVHAASYPYLLAYVSGGQGIITLVKHNVVIRMDACFLPQRYLKPLLRQSGQKRLLLCAEYLVWPPLCCPMNLHPVIIDTPFRITRDSDYLFVATRPTSG